MPSVFQVSGASSRSSQQTHASPKAQRSNGTSNPHRPALLALPGRSVRISSDPPSTVHSPSRQQQQLPCSAGKQQAQEPAKKSAAASPLSSPSGDASSASSRLAQRIASMHQKFAAATNLMDDDDCSSDAAIAV